MKNKFIIIAIIFIIIVSIFLAFYFGGGPLTIIENIENNKASQKHEIRYLETRINLIKNNNTLSKDQKKTIIQDIKINTYGRECSMDDVCDSIMKLMCNPDGRNDTGREYSTVTYIDLNTKKAVHTHTFSKDYTNTQEFFDQEMQKSTYLPRKRCIDIKNNIPPSLPPLEAVK